MQNDTYNPYKIGVFDSGIGGLTVLKECISFLPDVKFIYVADFKNVPYGDKPREDILGFTDDICRFFLEKGCSAILIACNTATSVAAEYVREKYPIKIIGVEPAIRPALEQTKKNVVVIATNTTIKLEKFSNLVSKLDTENRIRTYGMPELVTLTENFLYDEALLREGTSRILDQILTENQGTSAIVLGCTHFIYLKKYIREYLNQNEKFAHIQLFDGNLGTALHLKNTVESELSYLDWKGKRHILDNYSGEYTQSNSSNFSGSVEFYATTDKPSDTEKLNKIFFSLRNGEF